MQFLVTRLEFTNYLLSPKAIQSKLEINVSQKIDKATEKLAEACLLSS